MATFAKMTDAVTLTTVNKELRLGPIKLRLLLLVAVQVATTPLEGIREGIRLPPILFGLLQLPWEK